MNASLRSSTARTLAWLLAALAACGREPAATPTFDEELALAIRAGRDQLAEDERRALRASSHPLLAQLGDPDTAKLIRLFAWLPDASHARLRADGYLKWPFAELDAGRQKTLRELIQLNLDLAARQGSAAQPGFSLAALERSETGFATVALAGTDQRVVSWFVLWPELPNPTWVTVVNARAAGSQPYFQAHLEQLPTLRARPTSPPPSPER